MPKSCLQNNFDHTYASFCINRTKLRRQQKQKMYTVFAEVCAMCKHGFHARQFTALSFCTKTTARQMQYHVSEICTDKNDAATFNSRYNGALFSKRNRLTSTDKMSRFEQMVSTIAGSIHSVFATVIFFHFCKMVTKTEKYHISHKQAAKFVYWGQN